MTDYLLVIFDAEGIGFEQFYKMQGESVRDAIINAFSSPNLTPAAARILQEMNYLASYGDDEAPDFLVEWYETNPNAPIEKPDIELVLKYMAYTTCWDEVEFIMYGFVNLETLEYENFR